MKSMRLIEKFAKYVEDHKVPLTHGQKSGLIEANSFIPEHVPCSKIGGMYVFLKGNSVAVVLMTPAPKPVNDHKNLKIWIKLFGKKVDYQKYTSAWISFVRGTKDNKCFFVPKHGAVKKMDSSSAEWSIHNINSQGRMIFYKP